MNRTTHPGGCLQEDTVERLVARQLSDVERSRVLEHLDGCQECTEWVAGALRSKPGPVVGESSFAPATTLERGSVFAERYAVLQRVGRGGMGEVYATWDRTLQRDVALKVLVAHGRSDRAVARVLRESRAMARLSHPHVVPVFDAGWESEQPYVAMELVDGPTVRVWARGKPWREVLRVFVEVASGLGAAHRAGLVHRDVKPDNILVRADGRAVLGDFGLAVASSEDASVVHPDRVPSGARSTTIAGTYAYMSPERLSGAPADADSDIYSLCVSLYECLYEQLPFDVSPRPRRGEPRSLCRRTFEARGAPRAVSNLLRKGLDSDPGQRFATAEQFIRACARVARRRRVGGMIAASAVLSTIAVVGWTRSPPRAPGCETAQPRVRAIWGESQRRGVLSKPGGVALADGLDRYADAWLDAVDSACDRSAREEGALGRQPYEFACLNRTLAGFETFVTLVGRDSAVVDRGLDGLIQLPQPRRCGSWTGFSRLEPLPGPDRYERVERVRRALASTHAAALADPHAVGDREVGELRAQAAAIGFRPLEAEVHQTAALVALQVDEIPTARRLYLDATNTAIAGHHHRVAVESLVSLATIATDRGQLGRGEEYVDRAQAVYEGAAEPDSGLAAALAGTRGRLRMVGGDFVGAERHYRRALELGEVTHPARGGFYDGLVGALHLQGKSAAAIALAKEGLSHRERVFGAEHPYVGISALNLGGMLFSLGKTEDALPYVDRALRLTRSALPDSIRLARIYDLRAALLSDLGRFEDALTLHEKSAEILGTKVGSDDPLWADNLQARARVHAAGGDLETAHTLLNSALEVQREAAPRHLIRYQLEVQLADLWRRSGDLERSKTGLEATVEEMTEVVGASHFEVGVARLRLAETLLELGDANEAKRAVEAAITIFERSDGDSEAAAGARALRARVHERLESSAPPLVHSERR